MRAGVVVLIVLVAGVSCVPTYIPPPKQPIPKVDPKDFVVVVTDAASDEPKINPTTSSALAQGPTTPNPMNQSYPILSAGKYQIKPDEYKVAPPPEYDYSLKNAFGIQPPVKVFGQPPPERNPMEHKTPLVDPRPCYEGRNLVVEVIPAEREVGKKYAMLPGKYGCAWERDISREKASPAIRISNFTAGEVDDFSLQMISMGEGPACAGPGEATFNTVYWHVTGIRPRLDTYAHNFTIEEGASHDSRLLYGGTEQPNQWLEEYYGGPCPPADTTECFRFKVLAHLHDGTNCVCGHQDVLFYRPPAPEPEPAWSYDAAVEAPIGKKKL